MGSISSYNVAQTTGNGWKVVSYLFKYRLKLFTKEIFNHRTFSSSKITGLFIPKLVNSIHGSKLVQWFAYALVS